MLEINGPHEPIISRNHDLNLFIDEDIEITGEATLSRGNVQNSQMKIQWCYSPQGACNGTLSESNVDVDWDGLTYTFNINASELNLFDGKWNLTYFLQDEYFNEFSEYIYYLIRRSNRPCCSSNCTR